MTACPQGGQARFPYETHLLGNCLGLRSGIRFIGPDENHKRIIRPCPLRRGRTVGGARRAEVAACELRAPARQRVRYCQPRCQSALDNRVRILSIAFPTADRYMIPSKGHLGLGKLSLYRSFTIFCTHACFNFYFFIFKSLIFTKAGIRGGKQN